MTWSCQSWPGAVSWRAGLIVAALALAIAWPEARASTSTVTVRLTTPLSSSRSKPGDRIEGTVIGLADPDAAVPPGCVVTGAVVESRRRTSDQGRALLAVRFDGVRDGAGANQPAAFRLTAVDNAREHVDDDGTVVGLATLNRRPNTIEAVLMLAAHAHPLTLVLEEGLRLGAREVRRAEIEYGVGVTLSLLLTTPPQARPTCQGPSATEAPVDPEVATWLLQQPLRASAGTPPRDADWINFVMAGSEAAITQAFARAGWTNAPRTSMREDLRTFVALAQREGYSAGPVSLLTLDGAPPTMVFQKQNDTFAKRHHVRFWPTTGHAPDGGAAWVAAATHDDGLEFSHVTKHYTHRIDGDLDDERHSLLVDLVSVGAVRRYGFLPRPRVPTKSTNATGDAVTTDGRLAFVEMIGDAAVPAPAPTPRASRLATDDSATRTPGSLFPH